MAEVLYNFGDVNFVVAKCTECGPFTSSVYKHNDDIDFLILEADEHMRTKHGIMAER